jgi:hypothetical protein
MAGEFLKIDQAERACMDLQGGHIFFHRRKNHFRVTDSWKDLHGWVEPIRPSQPALFCWSSFINSDLNPQINIPSIMEAALTFVEKTIGFVLPKPEYNEDNHTYNVRYPGIIVNNLQYFFNDLHSKLEKEGPSILKVNRPDVNGVIRMGWIFDFTPSFMLKNDQFLIYDQTYKVTYQFAACNAPYFKYQRNFWTDEKPLTHEKYLIYPNSKSVTRLYSREEKCSMPQAVRIVMKDDTFIDIYGEQGYMEYQSGGKDLLDMTNIDTFKFLNLFWNANNWVKALNKNYVQVAGDDIYNFSINECGEEEYTIFKNCTFVNHFKGHKYPVWEQPKKKNSEPMCLMKDVALMWLWSYERNKTKKIIFDPSRTPGRSGEYLNLYQGFAVKPKVPLSGKLEDAAVQIRNHILEVLCGSNEIYYNFFLNSFACLIQNPGVKMEVVHVFKGPQGVGKNIVTNPILDIFGIHGIEVTQQRQFLGHFNQHMFNKILTVLNEAFWGGDKQAEGALKAVITEKKANYEPKGKNLTEGINYQNHIILSNEKWCVPLDTEDRRFCVYPVSAHRKGQSVYFSALAKAIQDGEKEELLWYLQNRVVPFNWRSADNLPPRIRGFVDQITQSRSNAPLKFFLNMFEDKGCWPPFISKEEKTKCRPEQVKTALKVEGAQVLGLDQYLETQTSTTQMLKELFGDCFDNRARQGSDSHRIYEFDTAEKCKQRLLDYIKCPTYFDDEKEPEFKKSKI